MPSNEKPQDQIIDSPPSRKQQKKARESTKPVKNEENVRGVPHFHRDNKNCITLTHCKKSRCIYFAKYAFTKDSRLEKVNERVQYLEIQKPKLQRISFMGKDGKIITREYLKSDNSTTIDLHLDGGALRIVPGQSNIIYKLP